MRLIRAFGFIPLLWFSIAVGQILPIRPPTIVRHPAKNMIFISEDDLTLECQAEGTPNITYSWKKDGFDLNLTLPNIKRGIYGTITISLATSLEEGYYQCFAENQYGTDMSITSYLRKAVFGSFTGTVVLETRVEEGKPIKIQALTGRSFPKPVHGWQIANYAMDLHPSQFIPSSRVQTADNGDLHFAYTKAEDDLAGKLYKSTFYNRDLDVKAGAGYTRLTVARGNLTHLSPRLGFASENPTIALVGETLSLRCFFYGYPLPIVSWHNLCDSPTIRGRYLLDKFSTELRIVEVSELDGGNYICSGSNNEGRMEHTLTVRIEAEPKFSHRPHNMNITEGDTLMMNCSATAKPEAEVTWLKNGQRLDVRNLPPRYSLSEDRTSLTIENLCRDCKDSNHPTDLSVIQCNASNVHGYAFASGYVNVLMRTEVTVYDVLGNLNASEEFGQESVYEFLCSITYDPSTPASPQWYKINSQGHYIRLPSEQELPNATLSNGSLTIRFTVNKDDAEWVKYTGEYVCRGENGYSSSTKSVFVRKQTDLQPGNLGSRPKDELVTWSIFLVIAAILIVSCLVFVFTRCYYKSSKRQNLSMENEIYRRTMAREDSVVPHYDTIPYDALSTVETALAPTPPVQRNISLENVQNKDTIPPVFSTVDPQYCTKSDELPATPLDHSGKAEKENDYFGLTEQRSADYLTLYTDLQQPEENRTVEDSTM